MAVLKVTTILIFSLMISIVISIALPAAPNYNKDGQIVFIGDSITEGWKKCGKSVWDKVFVPLGSVNTGVGGYTTQNVIDGINGGLIDNLDAHLAVLLIGTNDFIFGFSEASVVNNTLKILHLIENKYQGIRIILLGILPRGDDPLTHEKIQNVNGVTKNFADNSTIFFLDMEEQFSTGLGEMRAELYWADQLHLSSQGYVAFEEAIRSLFQHVLDIA